MVLPALSLTVRLWPVILLPVFESQESNMEGLGFCDRRRERRMLSHWHPLPAGPKHLLRPPALKVYLVTQANSTDTQNSNSEQMAEGGPRRRATWLSRNHNCSDH